VGLGGGGLGTNMPINSSTRRFCVPVIGRQRSSMQCAADGPGEFGPESDQPSGQRTRRSGPLSITVAAGRDPRSTGGIPRNRCRMGTHRWVWTQRKGSMWRSYLPARALKGLEGVSPLAGRPFVVGVDEGADRADEVGNAGERASSDGLAGDDPEDDLHQVHPGRRRCIEGSWGRRAGRSNAPTTNVRAPNRPQLSPWSRPRDQSRQRVKRT
jgi:hypothetical protein